jgi:hypothetical protein
MLSSRAFAGSFSPTIVAAGLHLLRQRTVIRTLAPCLRLALPPAEGLGHQFLALVGKRLHSFNGLTANVCNRILRLLQGRPLGALGGGAALARWPSLAGDTDGRMVGFIPGSHDDLRMYLPQP